MAIRVIATRDLYYLSDMDTGLANEKIRETLKKKGEVILGLTTGSTPAITHRTVSSTGRITLIS